MAHFLERKMRPLGETYSKSVRPLGLGRLTLVQPSPSSGSGDDLCTQHTHAANAMLHAMRRPCL